MRPELNTASDSDLESVFSTEEPKTSKQSTKNRYVCEFPGCGETFKRQVGLDRHEFSHTGVKKHACFYDGCNKSYKIITHLKRHINLSHEGVKRNMNVPCSFDFCDKMFFSTFSMQRHVREVHENPKIYECSHCKEKFRQRIKLRRHEVKHTGVYPFNCSKCSKGFVQEYHFERHVCIKEYECLTCHVKFSKWSEFSAHRKETRHSTTSNKCDICNKEFESKNALDEHKNTHATDREVYPCPIEGCAKFYSYKRHLRHHLQVNHEGKRFPCEVEGCGAKLNTRRTLRAHMQTMHLTKKDKKERKKRKDAGQRKQSTLTKLSGVVLDRNLERMIMDNEVEFEVDSEVVERVVTLDEIEEEVEKEPAEKDGEQSEQTEAQENRVEEVERPASVVSSADTEAEIERIVVLELEQL